MRPDVLVHIERHVCSQNVALIVRPKRQIAEAFSVPKDANGGRVANKRETKKRDKDSKKNKEHGNRRNRLTIELTEREGRSKPPFSPRLLPSFCYSHRSAL